MIEYTVMDYEGEAVCIDDGEILTVYADKGEHWEPLTCKFEPDEEEEVEHDDYHYIGGLQRACDRNW